MRARSLSLPIALVACWAMLGCEGALEAATGADQSAAEASIADPPGRSDRPGWAPEPGRSPRATQCLDLVESQAFAEAERVCRQALEEQPSPELRAALDDVRAILGDAPPKPR